MIDLDPSAAADHRAAAEWARAALADERAVILDTETTDLRGYICDIAIIRATDGEVLLNTLVNPGVPIEPGAQRVHGIGDADVKAAARFASIIPWLHATVRGRRVLVYNSSYDTGRISAELDRTLNGWNWSGREFPPDGVGTGLRGLLLDAAAWECIMLQYAAWVGEWNEYRGGYRWHKLTGGDHRALGDCRAARARLEEMAAG